MTTLSGWFRRAVERNAGGVALVAPGGSRTFADLDVAAGALANSITALLGRRPERVVVIGERVAATFEAYLGALYSGATVVPLSPETPDERNAEIAAMADVDLVLYSSQTRGGRGVEQFKAISAAVPRAAGFDFATGVTTGYLCSAQPGQHDGAYIVFTSGTTGRPKGVPISHGNIDAYLRAVQDRFRPSPEDVFSQIHEMTFDFSVYEMWVAWSGAACLSSIPRVQALDPVRAINARGITFWSATPSLVEGAMNRGLVPPDSLPGLRYTMFCGEALTERTARRWYEAAPQAVLDNLYGPTELTVTCTGQVWSPRDGVDPAEVVAIGHPHPGMEFVLLDEGGAVRSDEGELCMTGPQMFGGYLDSRDDAGAFAEVDGRRWYRTGDRARLDADGVLRHLGRIDSQVKIRGYRVELSEVEAAVGALVHGRQSVAVDVRDDAGASLAVFVATEDDIDVDAVRGELAKTLPVYMVPRQILTIPEMPMNDRGKADRNELRRLARGTLSD